jgi:hypothetical protein
MQGLALTMKRFQALEFPMAPLIETKMEPDGYAGFAASLGRMFTCSRVPPIVAVLDHCTIAPSVTDLG